MKALLKKSQSSIIIIVLLVLIALAAIAILSAFIISQVRNSTQDAEIKSKLSSLTISVVDASAGNNYIILKKESNSDINLADIRVTINGKAVSTSYDNLSSWGVYETRKIIFGNYVLAKGDSLDIFVIAANLNKPMAAEVAKAEVIKDSTNATISLPGSQGSGAQNSSNTNFYLGLIAYFPFDGNAIDYSGNNVTATLLSGMSYNSSGILQQSLQYPGSDTSYVSLNNSKAPVGQTQFSISIWTKIYNTGPFNGANLVQIGPNYQPLHQFNLEYRFPNSTTGSIEISSYSACTYDYYMPRSNLEGVWHNIIFTYDGSSKEILYDNGFPVLNSSGCSLNLYTGMYNLGYREYYGGNGPKGQIDEVAVWNRTLTSTEVSQIYNQGKGLSLK